MRAAEITGTGRGMQFLGQGMADVADTLVERDQETARAWSAEALSKARLDWTSQLIERQSKAEPGAPNFTEGMLKDYDEYMDKSVESAPSGAAKKFMKERMLEMRTQIGEGAMRFEAQARIDYRSDKFTSAIDNTEKLMNTDPSQYKIALAEQLAVIDSANLPPIKKSELRQKAVDRISGAAVWSQIQKSPNQFLDSIGFMGATDPATGKVRKSSGNITGMTGNPAFDALPFERRTQMFEGAIRLKAQIDGDANIAAEKVKKQLAEDAMKEGWGRLASGKLNRAYVEQIRPLLSAPEYHSLLEGMKQASTGGVKTDPGTFRHLQELLYSDPPAAHAYALKAHKNGLLSNENLSSALTHAKSLKDSEGPKNEFQRTRSYIRDSLDPGPMVQDPVGKSRFAEALYTYDSWVNSGKHTDEEIAKRGKEIVGQYKFIDFSDTVMALPQPRSGSIRRSTTDPNGMLSDVGIAAKKAQSKLDKGEMTKQEFDQEMVILNRWRKAASGGK